MYGIVIANGNGVSQYQQVYEQLRDNILSGSIPPEIKMASTRQMASELNISRTIILEVIDQLKAEGYLETRHGSGTYILPRISLPKEISSQKGDSQSNFINHDENILSFIAGMPDLSLFPRRVWTRMYNQAIEYADEKDLSYNHPKGYFHLRQELCQYLYRTKGIKTTASNIFLTAGSAQALGIISELKTNPSITMEDPSAPFVREIFCSKSNRLSYGEVDEQGIIPDSAAFDNTDFLYITPSHQYPLGSTLPAQRRIEILKQALRTGTFIIEDDYDGEYRFGSRPIAPLQVLSPEQVIYVGTFSKILSPALRLGYMVVPDGLIGQIMKIKKRWNLLNENLNQMAMARFISEGHIYRHLRKSLRSYKIKKTEIEQLVIQELGNNWMIQGNTTGLHMVLKLESYDFTDDFREKMVKKGILFEPVYTYSNITLKHKDKLVLGYGHRSADEVYRGLKILGSLL